MAPAQETSIIKCVKCAKKIADPDLIVRCLTCQESFHNGCMTARKLNKVGMKSWKCGECSEKPNNELKSPLPLTIAATNQCSSDPNISIRSLAPMKSNTSYITRDDLQKMFGEFKTNIAGIMEDKLLIKYSELAAQNNSILQAIELMSTKYDDVMKRVNDVEEKCAAIKHIIQKNETLTKRVTYLEEKLDALENKGAETEIEIRGLPESRQENLQQSLINISSTINSSVDKKDIISIHRKPHTGAQAGGPKPVVVKFSGQQERDTFILSLKKFNKNCKSNTEKLNTSHLNIAGPLKPIYVSEHLSQRMKYLLMAAKKFSKENRFAFCWYKGGGIYLKKQDGAKTFRIRSEEMLAHIL